MGIHIVFTVVISLLTTSSEKPLCCYATERGWIVYALGSPDLHVVRPHIREGFAERIVLLSGNLRPSNLKDHKLSALVVGNRLIIDYDYDFDDGGFLSTKRRNVRCRGECSVGGLFDWKIIDQNNRTSKLFTNIINRTITGDLFEEAGGSVVAVNCYATGDNLRMLGWFGEGDVKNDRLPVELFKVDSPFKGYFKVIRVKDRYFFIADRGILFTSLCDKIGKPLDIQPVFLGIGESITAVVSIVSTKKVYAFTRTKHFELGSDIPTPKLLNTLNDITYSKADWISKELIDRTHDLYRCLVDNKVIKPTKIESK